MEYQAHVRHMNDMQEGKTLVLTIRDLSPGKPYSDIYEVLAKL